MEAEPPHGLALCPAPRTLLPLSLRVSGVQGPARRQQLGLRAGPGSNSWRGVSTASRVILRYLGPRSTGRRPPLWGGPPASLSPPTLPETPSQTPQNNVPPAIWAPP